MAPVMVLLRDIIPRLLTGPIGAHFPHSREADTSYAPVLHFVLSLVTWINMSADHGL
jgi:hypothetical protein